MIYYVKRTDAVIWMLTLYAKNEAESISASALRRIKDAIDA